MTELRDRALLGSRWSLAGSLGTTLLQLTQVLILARLLGPAAFGLMALLLVLIRSGTPLMELGLTQAIIQRRDLKPEHLAALHAYNVMAGLLLSGLIWVLATPLSKAFGAPELQELLPLGGAVFFISALGAQFHALLQRNFAFRTLSFIQTAAVAAEVLLSILLALNGFGVWSLLWGLLLRSLLQSTLYLLAGWRLRTRAAPDWRGAGSMLRFGLFEAGNQLSNLLSSQLDRLLVGTLLGMEALGLYSLTWDLALLPLARINPIINRVAYPVYAELQADPERLDRYYRTAVRFIFLLNLPLLVGMMLTAAPLLELMYGADWVPAAPALMWLALAALMKAIGNPGGGVLLAKGYPELGLGWNLFWMFTFLPLLYFGLVASPSLYTVALLQCAGAWTLGWGWHYLLARYGGIEYRKLLTELGRVLLLVLPMVLVVLTLQALGPGGSLGLAIQVVAGGLAYFGAVYKLRPDIWTQTLRFFQ